MERIANDTSQVPRTPPRFRKLVLVSAAVLLLAIGLVAVNAGDSAAQTTPLIDYDLDDDNLIEVRTRDQFQAIHHDLDGDGSPTTLNSGGYTTAKTWEESFPNAMPNAGCPLRDHDNDANTANERKCIGYELLADVNFSGQTYVPFGKNGVWGAVNMTAKIVGNGFRVMNPSRGVSDNAVLYGVIGVVGEGASVEGLGVINPRFGIGRTQAGGITGELKGTITGSYTKGGRIREGGNIGGLAGTLNTGTSFAGKIAHSYVLGGDIGRQSQGLGGLIGSWNANTGTNVSQCINSYFSGTIDQGPQPRHGLIAGQKSGGTITNCVGDNTTDGDVSKVWFNSSASDNSSYAASKANMVAVTDYDTPATNNPFANWDDYDAAGVALASGATRTDFWYFGDSTTFPVLKGWGHDHTEAMARAQSGSQTVNLCTRTLAVANEIIRLLKDDDRAPGVTTTPAAVTALTDCTAASDTRNVSITNLTNLVVTSETNPLNLNPDRTDPASAKLTALDMNDFAYLTNATHFNLSGNSFTTLPPRLFQGVPLRWLDLSDNALTTIPADLFAGMGTVTATTGNMLLLNGNSLTYTGIADRVFDPLTYLNGLDLSDNSLTRVNTRWFEDLANLGRRPATGAAFRDKLGLHLSGNTITEHYYSNKLFTGVRENVVTYTGATAGDTLRTAIKAAIAESAGGTTPTTLDLDATDHFDNLATPPAYLGAIDTCPLTAVTGPAGHTYFGDLTPQCYISPKWSPPYVTGATTPAPTGFTLTAFPTILRADFTYTFGADFIALQLRYRATPANPSDPWTEEWGTEGILASISGATTYFTSFGHVPAGVSYQLQLRALSRTAPPSTPVTGTVTTPTSPDAPQGLSATTSTTAAGAIELSWTPSVSGHLTQSKYQYQSKLSTAQAYGAWSDVTGSDYRTDSYTLSGLTPGSQYDIQIRLHWSDAVGASAASAVAMATASGVPTPTGFEASPGATAGSINLSWTAVTGATGYQFRCNPAGTGCTDTWQSAGTGTTHTATGLTGGDTYSLELRALLTGSPESSAATATARAQTQPPPRNLSANVGSIPGELRITWIAPITGTVSRYDYRYKQSSAADESFTEWTRVPDANNDNDFTNDLSLALTGLLGATSYDVQLRVVLTGGEMSLEQHVSHATSPVPAPLNFMATAGSGPGEVDLSWDAPTGITVLRYEVRNRRGTGDWSRWNAVGTVTTYTYSGLVGGSSHEIQLRTVMTGAGPSAAVSANASPPLVPPPATFTAATSVFPGEINIEWSAVTNATSYEIRTKATTANWPAGGGWTSIPARWTSATALDLAPGVAHNVELRAVVAEVGRSTVEETQADSGAAEVTGTATLPDGYAVDTATLPGRIAITLPGSTDPFIYRTRTANPGEWSRWRTVRPEATDLLYLITGLEGGVEYDVELRVYLGMTDGFTTALTAQVEALALDAPADFEVSEATGALVMRWTNPNPVDADSYQYRQRATGTADWSDWVTVMHDGARDAQQQRFVTNLESGGSYQFEIRMTAGALTSPVASASATVRASLPELDSIKPEVRELTMQAGDTVRLGVNLYGMQGELDNTIATGGTNAVLLRWSEMGTGGGSFADPSDGRRVVYTAPSSPGRYTVTAEAQPDGICASHHAAPATISAANRAPCIATFTITVTRAPGDAGPQPDPVNPTGEITTSLTDNAGVAYTVFTPVDGGTFDGEGFTVSAPAGAVPDRTVLGVAAAVSAVPVPTPVPGASMSVAGNWHDINGILQSGQAPLEAYSLDDALTVCLPFPDEFRADLSNVVAVERKPDGGIGILTSKVRANAGDLTVCAALSTLPATVGVAKLGTVAAPPATPTPEQDLPDTGATAPSGIAIVLMLLAGLAILTGIHRTRRMIRG